jgi:uncharacterized protein YndB with AHSA1/START domain
MLKKIALTLCALVALFIVVGFFLPASYDITRTRLIKAPADKLFPLVNTPKRWNDWSTWNMRDPKMQQTFSGPDSGTGAQWQWISKQEGSGSIAFVAVEPNKRIDYKMNFEGWSEPAAGAFTFESKGVETQVTWSMKGNLGVNPVNRYFGLLMGKFVGPEFEKGLENLEKAAQK